MLSKTIEYLTLPSILLTILTISFKKFRTLQTQKMA